MYGGDEDVNPGVYPQANGLASSAVAIQNDLPESEQEGASAESISEMLGPVMNPTTGGQQANNGITGANSPLTQGTI
jgi:hypothetical protein